MDFDFLKNTVKRQQILYWQEEIPAAAQQNASLHIAYGIDDNFVMPMGIAILSIIENNRQENFVFHVLTEELSENSIQLLAHIAKQQKTMICIHYIDSAIFEKLPSTDHFTKATYNRFLLPKVLQGITRRVIYLDADILCLGAISGLKTLDFAGKTAAVVQDIGPVAQRQVRKLGLKSPRYFNARFLYIDIDRWEEQQISEKALEFSFANLGKLNWLDQDALNVVLEDKTRFIEECYDYIFDFGLPANAAVTALPEGTVFVHYAGRYKPWQQWCMHPLRQDFLKYRQLSPWADKPLLQPRNYKDMKKMAHSYRKTGKFFESLRWYAKYAWHKLKAI